MLTKDTPWPSKDDIIDQTVIHDITATLVDHLTVIHAITATLVDHLEADLFILKRTVASIHAEYDEETERLKDAEELAKSEMQAFVQKGSEYLNSDEGKEEAVRMQLARIERPHSPRRALKWSDFSSIRGLDHWSREIERHRTALAALYAKMGG